ncbi:MAG: hypothetical protein FWH57_06705 [Oscillospiraceae bacterium]|nr:hypothetical protein [Oscillospiraceae bacterium]
MSIGKLWCRKEVTRLKPGRIRDGVGELSARNEGGASHWQIHREEKVDE